MAPSASAPNSPPPCATETADNDLQPFFVLHKASSQKCYKKSGGSGKTRRRIELSPSLLSNGENAEIENADEFHYHQNVNMRIEAFHAVWSEIEETIKDVLRDINMNTFKAIYHWVNESFNTISTSERLNFLEATRSFPIVTNVASKQLFTGLVLTKNMEFVDDQMTFKELGMHLKSKGCHVANLSSLDFSAKNGIGGCLKSLFREFLLVTLDAVDISVLTTWYRKQQNCDSAMVIIISDMEQCHGSILSDFILMLSEWVLKVPVILIMGVTTTPDALRGILPSNVIQHLCPRKFILGSPSERMNAIVEAVLVKKCSSFSIGYEVAVFMRNYFFTQDGTITSFIRALKIACAQHFSLEPLSFLLQRFAVDDNNEGLQCEMHGISAEMILKQAFDLPSYRINKLGEQSMESLVRGFSELKNLQRHWSIVVLCLYEAGKWSRICLLDLICEALDPELFKLRVSSPNGFHNNSQASHIEPSMCKQYHRPQKGGFIRQAVRSVRDLPAVQLSKLLKVWEKITVDVPQIHEKVMELLSLLKFEEGKTSKEDMDEISKSARRYASRNHLNIAKVSRVVNDKAARLLESMVRNHMEPVECAPFHEIVCFKSIDKLKGALIGDPRRRVQVDLLQFQDIIQCGCCRTCNSLSPSMHDSSIMYSLAQEHGDLINLHDWYQSFKSVCLCSSNKGKHGSKYSPSPKKRKVVAGIAKPSEASIQARFCRAVTELKIVGLLQMPSKRRPDFVQRLAFGT
ncbi:hypothetical protein K2173_026472 [Erythroxylum novogranatense]|uniref:Origin of replication complex subunit 3 n=1 Tax=Erythroxylum novogranatense TaxID=1862640 RepID=A0AAV8TWF3_9ROSI|nr:hypothetical protein K2173_026472 [Erythroxylum novogranatense]